ncbi:MAG: hypothetical protein H7232_16570 [Aeromicrobium sp.]|nr:hypothetical protein [Burkholderiales bacterium]
MLDLVLERQAFGTHVDLHDLHADQVDASREYGVSLLSALPEPGDYAALVVAVAHDEFRQLGIGGLWPPSQWAGGNL